MYVCIYLYNDSRFAIRILQDDACHLVLQYRSKFLEGTAAKTNLSSHLFNLS